MLLAYECLNSALALATKSEVSVDVSNRCKKKKKKEQSWYVLHSSTEKVKKKNCFIVKNRIYLWIGHECSALNNKQKAVKSNSSIQTHVANQDYGLRRLHEYGKRSKVLNGWKERKKYSAFQGVLNINVWTYETNLIITVEHWKKRTQMLKKKVSFFFFFKLKWMGSKIK